METAMNRTLERMMTQPSVDPKRWKIVKKKSEHHLEQTRLRGDFLVTIQIGGTTKQVIIEMDGEQHFLKSSYWNKFRSLEDNQVLDRQKNSWCERNNRDLLRISFSVPYSSYDSHVLAFMKKVQQKEGREWVYMKVGKEYHLQSTTKRG